MTRFRRASENIRIHFLRESIQAERMLCMTIDLFKPL